MSRTTEFILSSDIGLQRWVSRVRFSCPICTEVVHQEVPVPMPNPMAEKTRDMTVDGEVELTCPHCNSFFEGDVWAGPAHCDITLSEYPDTRVKCDPPGYDAPAAEDWIDDWEVPDEPKNVFDYNAQELRRIIDTQASTLGNSLINRMIFSQILTFLEAYFCDNLIQGLRQHPDLLIAFSEKDGSIQNIQMSPATVLRDPESGRKLIESNLKNRLYHQFGSSKKKPKTGKPKTEGVPLWYALAFGFELTPTEEDLDKLRNYALLRHDCVHRNGHTKDGEELDLFDQTYLLDALDTAIRVVDHVQNQMYQLQSLSA